MSETLSDPDQQAHAIIGTREDGSPLRNDGMPLQDAKQNPWYVLATVHGEQAEDAHRLNYDADKAAKNREAWNLWYCHELDDEDLLDRAQKVGLTPEDLVPFKDGKRDELAIKKKLALIRKEVIKRLKNAKAQKTTPPDPAQNIVFSQVHFSKYLNFENFVFEKKCVFGESVFTGAADFVSATFTGYADFVSATFTGSADFVSATFMGSAYFGSATFMGDAYFGSATFMGYAYFGSATFTGSADFVSATFTGSADFVSATFTGYAYFRSATFTGDAGFRSATFMGSAYFSWDQNTHEEKAEHPVRFFKSADFNSAKFKSTTRFTNVQFLTHVPEFHAAELYDDTVFAARDRDLGNWPPLKGEGVMEAKKQKRAYNRLRLFMNRSLQIDEEQFFHRMEMRCKWQLAGWGHKPLYALFELLSDFGNSVARPAGWLSVVWLSGVIAKLGMVKGGVLADLWTIGPAMGWSFANLFSFFGFRGLFFEEAKELPALLQVTSGVQTVLGFVLLFLLGLGLRNRFRLR